MPRSATTGVYTRVVNSFSQPVFGTLIDPTDADAYFDDLDVGLNPPNFAGPMNVIGALTLGKAGTTVGTLGFFNATSGSITLSPPTGALGSAVLTLPDATDTLVGKATTDILSNKTLVAPVLGVATATTINGITITPNTGTLTLNTNTLAIAGAGIALTITGTTGTTLTFQGTDTYVGRTTTDELTNKTLTSSVGKGTWTASGTWTLPAFTLGGTIAGGNNQLNDIIIGTSSPRAGSFTTLAASDTLTGTKNGNTNYIASSFGNSDAGATAFVTQNFATTNAGTMSLQGSSTAAGGLALWRWTGAGGMFFDQQNAAGSMLFRTGATPTNALVLDNAQNATVTGNVVAGGNVTTGNFFTSPAPVTTTINRTISTTDSSVIWNGAGSLTATMPAAASFPGRWLNFKNIAAQTVVSNASNVVPLAGGAAGTAILAATGTPRWARLQSDGTNWIIMEGN